MRFFNKILKTIIFGIIIFILINIGLYVYAFITPKQEIKKTMPYTFYDLNNNVFSNGNKNGQWVTLNNIGVNIVNATIAVEDKNFYNHIGFDYLRISKTVFQNIINWDIIGGASTITQQYAKNLYLTFDKTWKRKINEAFLTFELETHYSKDEILEGYLNTINYGKGVYGIENASLFYFGKYCNELSVAEAAMLAGIPNSPSNYSPLINLKNAKKRQLIVLEALEKNDFITTKEKKDAYNEELVYIGENNKEKLVTLMYYQDAVLSELKSIKSIPSTIIKNGGLKIYTNLDINAQKILEDSVIKNMKNDYDAGISGAVMIPNTGEIIALTGGVNFAKYPYNRAINSKRQVGSAMKPILYYAALENGFTASSTFLSSPTTFVFDEDKSYSPKNYNNKYADKNISLAAAIAYSDNIYAVKSHMFLGEEVLVNMANRIGIDEQLQAIPSLALGTIELNLVDFVGAYGAFANEGYKVEPHLINKIKDNKGNIIYERKISKEKVLNSDTTFVLNELLSNTYNYNMVDYSTPTLLSVSHKLRDKFAVKSGTTNTDYVTIGYNKNAVVGIWFGYDDNSKVKTEQSKITKNIWAETIQGYLWNNKNEWYSIPDNIVGVLVNPITGKPAKETDKIKQILYYKKGSEPYNQTHIIEDFFLKK